MGGRVASIGLGFVKHNYGTEYETLHRSGKIKFVRSTSGSAKAPMETRTKGRIYATVNNQNKIKSISFYDRKNKRRRQIDVTGSPHTIKGKKIIPHVHKGYNHNEKGDRNLTIRERKLLARIQRIWDNRNR